MKRSHDTLHRTGFFLFSEKRATIEAEGNLPGNEEYRERLIGVISYSTKTQPKRQPARRYSHPTAKPPKYDLPGNGNFNKKDADATARASFLFEAV